MATPARAAEAAAGPASRLLHALAVEAASQLGVDSVFLVSRGRGVRVRAGRDPGAALPVAVAQAVETGRLAASAGGDGDPAWACAPLRDGTRVHGALCVMDTGRREWSDVELHAVERWAAICAAAVTTVVDRSRLRRERDDFESLARHNPDLVARFDAGMRHLYANPAVEAATGLSVVDFVGRTNEELGMPAELVEFWNEARRSVFETGVERTIEYSYMAPDGERHFQSRVVPEVGEEGAVRTVLGITRDITALKRIEQELRQSRQELEDFFENATVGLHMVGADGTILWANRFELQLLGYDRDEYVGRNITEFHVDDDVIDDIIERLKLGEKLHEVDARMRTRDGSIRYVRISSSALFEDEAFVRTRCFTTDITERVRAEQERERLMREVEVERARLHSLFVKAPAFMAALRGPDHVFEAANPAYVTLIGGREVVGLPIRKAVPELEGQGYFELLEQVYRTGEPYVAEGARVEIRRAPGGALEDRFVNFVFQPLTGADEKPNGIFVHGVDVTELVRARQEAQAANAAKSGFLATVSHELRTPLNAMIGYTDLLKLGVPEAIPDRSLQQVERIALSARHLLELIEEILTFSRIEGGHERVNVEALTLHDLVSEVSAIIEPLARDRGLEFSAHVPDNPVSLRTDPRKLRQILLNLVGNAIKFTDQGSVEFRYERENGAHVFEVADTGAGIDPDHMDKIFEPFWQANAAHTSRSGGTGLGLAVAREFARLLQGDISVESLVDQGTTFTLRLPDLS